MNSLLLKLFEETSSLGVEGAETTSSTTTNITWQDILDMVIGWATNTGYKLVIAIVILIVSFIIINFISKKISKKLAKRKADPTLSRVLVNVSRIALKILIVTCLVNYVGIATASVSAVIFAIGTGISLALQGALSNFAGGVIIIVMRPFKLGDYITSSGESGTVEDIKLFYTYITTPDNRVVMIPNGTLANNVIVNASAKDTRRVDVEMSISYSADLELAKTVAKEVCAKNESVLQTPAPFAEVINYDSSSVVVVVRCWCNRTDYWNVKFYMLREIKKAYDEANIEIPFNQLDVNFRGPLEIENNK